ASILHSILRDAKFNTVVTVAGTKQFEVDFKTPKKEDVAQMQVYNAAAISATDPTAGLLNGLVLTLQDGRSDSALANFERLVAASADNTFVFGDQWGRVFKYGTQFLATFIRDLAIGPDSALTIDT